MLNVLGDAFLIFYAIWTIVEQLSYFFGLSFAQSWLIAWSTGMIGVGVFFFMTGTGRETGLATNDRHPSSLVSNDVRHGLKGLWKKFTAMCLRRYGALEDWIANSLKFQTFYEVTVFLRGASELQPRAAWLRFRSMETDTHWNLACWVCALAAAVATMCLHRPDADDATYLGNAVYALDFAEVPIRTLTALANGYVLTSYDFIRAAFSWATGIPILVSYYILWPAFIAILVVVFQFRIFRLAGVKSVAVASIVFFVVMLAWGDVHRTPANFGFVRLFQGKGPLIWLAIPAAMYYWILYTRNNESRPLVLLYCATIVSVGFSPTGVLTSLLLVGLFSAATLITFKFTRTGWHRVFAIGLAGIYPLTIGLVMRFYFGYSSQGVHTATGILDSANNYAILDTTFLGSNMRGAIALLALVAAPFLLKRITNSAPFQSYFWICIVLLAFPWTSEVFAKLGFMTFSWRWLYVLPFALAMVIAVDQLGQSNWPPLVRRVTMVLAVATFAFSSSHWVVSAQNYTEVRMPGFKLPNPNKVFLSPYGSNVKIEGVWITSPATGSPL